jgi:hypothetical protein
MMFASDGAGEAAFAPRESSIRERGLMALTAWGRIEILATAILLAVAYGGLFLTEAGILKMVEIVSGKEIEGSALVARLFFALRIGAALSTFTIYLVHVLRSTWKMMRLDDEVEG